tara:strand:- start:17458 stop:18126 length:669 start_codon:yes stop_codon:yes gene_type:complete
MQTIVTSYANHPEYLDDFRFLADRFYPSYFTCYDIAPEGESKGSQILRILETIAKPYFILIEDDFFFIRAVIIEKLRRLGDFCREHEVDRFSLQSKNAHSFSDWTAGDLFHDGKQIFKTNEQVQIPFSMEASIWRRDFMLEHVEPWMTERDIEVTISNRIRNKSHKIYAFDDCVLHYRDAMRNGRRVISLDRKSFTLSVNKGEELALYPDLDNSKDRRLCLT